MKWAGHVENMREMRNRHFSLKTWEEESRWETLAYRKR